MTEFRSRWGRYVTTVTVNNTNIVVSFTGMRDGGSYFSTNDKALAETMKKMKNYGNDFYLFREDKEADSLPGIGEDIKEELPKEEPQLKAIESVTDISQAREYLRENGIDFRKLNSPNAILKQAKGLGVTFPNLKLE